MEDKFERRDCACVSFWHPRDKELRYCALGEYNSGEYPGHKYSDDENCSKCPHYTKKDAMRLPKELFEI